MRRFVAALGLALIAAPASGIVAHECPHHEAPTTIGAGAGDGGHASHARHGARESAPGSDPSSDTHGSRRCTCIAVCHGAAGAAAPAAMLPGPRLTPSGEPTAVLAPDPDRPSRAALRLLPFANAPPLRS